MNYPEIRFRESFLLIGAIYADIEPAYMPPISPNDERYKLSTETINSKLAAYEQAWRPYEKKLIKEMCALLGKEFRQNTIDIYAAPFRSSFSFPMIIATKYDPDRAIEVIAHELLHILLYDNVSAGIDYAAKEAEWRQLFNGVDDTVALIHIPVHAALQALFDDVLQEPERTIRDKEMCATYAPYHQAWEYVERVGYKKVIEMITGSSDR